jgi:serine/threonine protein kinase
LEEDIKGDNILMHILDHSILQGFGEDEQMDPSPRKYVNGTTIYESRSWREPNKYGIVVLTDFAAAVSGEETHDHKVQPDAFRAPEVLLGVDWSYPIDLWNVGCMVSLMVPHRPNLSLCYTC